MTSTAMSDRVWRLLSKERYLDVLAALDKMSHGESGAPAMLWARGAALNGVNRHAEALAILRLAMPDLYGVKRAWCRVEATLTLIKTTCLVEAANQITSSRMDFKEHGDEAGLAVCDFLDLHVLQRKGSHRDYVARCPQISRNLLTLGATTWHVHAETQRAFSLRVLGHFEEAQEAADQILPFAKQLGLTYRLAQLWFNEAACCLALNKRRKSLRALEISEKLCRKTGGEILMADILLKRSLLIESEGDLPTAISYAQQAARLYKNLGQNTEAAWAYVHMGSKLKPLRQIQQAGAAFQEAYKLAKKEEDFQLLGEIKLRMADIHMAIGQNTQARTLFEEIIRTAEDGNMPRHLVTLAAVYSTITCEPDQFDLFCERAKNALISCPPSIYQTVAQRILAVQLAQHDRIAEARVFLRSAISNSDQWPQQKAMSLIGLVECEISTLKKTPDMGGSHLVMREIGKYLAEIKKSALLLPEINARALLAQATISQLSNKPDKALSYVMEAIHNLRVIRLSGSDPALVSSLSGQFDHVYWRGAQLAHDLGDVESLISFIEHRRAQWLTREINVRTENPAPLSELNDLQRDLRRLRSSSFSARVDPELSAALHTGFAEVTRRYAQMDADLMFAPSNHESFSSSLRQHTPLAGLLNLRGAFNSLFGQTWVGIALESVSHDGSEWILMRMTPNQVEHRVISANSLIKKMLQILAEGSSRFRRRFFGSQNNESPEFIMLKDWLGANSWLSGIEDSTQTPTLIVADAGWISRLPLGNLPMRDSRSLGESVILRFAPSLNTMAMLGRANLYKNSDGSKLTSEMRALIVAPRIFDQRNRDLSYSIQEANLIRQCFPNGKSLLNEQATVSNFRELAQKDELAEFDLIFFSTHANAEPRHLRLSGLAMRDGDLTLQEMLSWRLNARLVCLSACDSSFSATLGGEERLGLETALIAAGAHNVLSTLWPISDSAAPVFMRAFLRHYVTLQNAAHALMLTNIELRDTLSPADLSTWRVTGPE